MLLASMQILNFNNDDDFVCKKLYDWKKLNNLKKNINNCNKVNIFA